MAWVWWLAGPVVATVLAACWSWLRARPARTPTTVESMQAHGEFLDALAETARSRERGLRSPDGSAVGLADSAADGATATAPHPGD